MHSDYGVYPDFRKQLVHGTAFAAALAIILPMVISAARQPLPKLTTRPAEQILYLMPECTGRHQITPEYTEYTGTDCLRWHTFVVPAAVFAPKF